MASINDLMRLGDPDDIRAELTRLRAENEALRADNSRIIHAFRSAAEKVNSQKHNTFADATEAIADIILEYVNESKAN